MNVRSILLVAVAIGLLLGVTSTAQAATYYSRASANWGTGTTWSTAGCGLGSAGATPTAADDVEICNGYTVTMNGNPGVALSLTINGTANWTVARTTNIGAGGITTTTGGTASGTATGTLTTTGNLTVPDGATLTVGRGNVTVTGTTTIGGGTSGGLTINSATGAKIFTGGVTISSGGTWDNSANSAITFRGGLTNNGTCTAGTGVYTFDTNSQAVGGSATSIPNVTVTGAAVTLTNNITSGGLTVGAALSGTGGLTQGANAILTISGTSGITTLTAGAAAGNTVNYDGAAQTVKAAAYRNLTLKGSGIVTLPSGLTTINGNLTLSGTVTTATGDNMAVGGNLDVQAGNTLTVAGYTFSVTGTTAVAGTLAHSSATGAKSYTGLVTVNTGGSLTNAGAAGITFAGGVTNNATFNIGNGAVSYGSAVLNNTGGAFTSGTGVQTFTGGDLTHTGTAFNAGTGSFTFSGGGQQIVCDGSHTLAIPTLTVNNTVTNNCTGGLTVSTSLDGSSTLTQGANAILALSNAWTIAGLAASASPNTVSYTSGSADQTVFGTTYHNLTINKTGRTATLDNATTTNGTLKVTAGTLNTNNYKVTLNGDFTNSGTFTAGNSDIEIGGTNVAQSIAGFTATGALSCTKTGGTATLQGNVTAASLTLNGSGGTLNLDTATHSISGNMVVTAGTLDAAASNFTVTGTTSITDTLTHSSSTGTKIYTGLVTNNGTWTNSGNSAITFRGGLTNNGTFTAGTGVYTFDVNSQAIGGSATSIPSVTVTSPTVLTNNITAGGLTVGTALSGTGGLTQGASAILNIGGTSGITALIATAAGNTVNYTSTTAAQTVIGTTYHNLTVNKNGQTATLGNATTTNGTLNIAAGTLDTSGSNYAVTLNGDFANSGAFTANASTITIGGSDNNPHTIAGFTTTGAVAFNRTVNTDTLAGAVTSGAWTANGAGGTLDLGAGLSHAVTGNVTLTAGTLNGGSSSLDLTGNFTGAGTFTPSTGTVNFNSTGAQTAGGYTYNVLKANNAAGVTLGAAATVTTLTIGDVTANSIFDDGGFGVTSTGTLNLTSGTFRVGAASYPAFATNTINSGTTVEYYGAGAQTAASAPPYQNLLFSGAGTKTLGGSTTVNGNLNISAGTLDVSASNFALDVKGNWTNSGTFNPRAGTVAFNGAGAQTINSANTWHDLAVTGASARTASFQSGVAQTIGAGGTLTLTGASGQLLTLAPTAGSAWLLNFGGTTQNVSYVSASYSDASGGQTITADATDTNGGNNTNWHFVTSAAVASDVNPSTYGQSVTFTATLTGSGGTPSGTVTFKDGAATLGTGALNGSGLATFSTTTLSVGSHVITADYGGDATYSASTGTLGGGQTVNAAALTVTANDDSKTYGQTKSYGAGSTAFTSLGLQNGETIGSVTIAASGGTAAADPVGSYTLTPSAAIGGTFNAGNYLISYATGTLTVNGAALTVTADNDSKTYGQTKPYGAGSTAFTSLGLQNGETIGSVTIAASGGTAAADPVGSYTLTPSAATGGTFNAGNYLMSYATGTLSVIPGGAADYYVIKKDTELVVRTPGVLANDGGDPLTASKVSDPPSGAVSLASNGTFTYTPAGGYTGMDSFTYKATGAGLDSSDVTVTITVIDSSATTVAINDAYSTPQDAALFVTSSADGLLSNDTGTSLSVASADGPFHGMVDLASDGTFTYTPDAGYTGADSFLYSAGSNTAMVMIAVRAPGSPLAVNDVYSSYQDNTFSVSAPGLISNDTGTTLTASLVSGPLYGTLSELSSDGSFTYTPDSGFIGADAFMYRVTDESSNSSNIATVLINVSSKITTTTTVGSSSSPSTYGDSVAFTATATDGATGTVSFKDGLITLGTGTLNESSPNTATFSTSAPSAGSHSITAVYGGDSTYAGSTSSGLTQTVNTASLSVTADAKSKTYGASEPALTYSASGFVNGDTIAIMSGSLTRAAGENIGPYAITQGTVSAGGNYTISYTGANLTIGTASLSITAAAKSKTYGESDPALTYSASGFVNGDTIAIMGGGLTRAAGENVGPYAINQGTVSAGGNYTISYTGANLTISAASQTITFGALADKTLGDLPFSISATSDSGLAVSFSSLTDPVCTVSGRTVTIAGAGTCTIRASQSGNANYSPAAGVDRSFTVNAGAPKIIVSVLPDGSITSDPTLNITGIVTDLADVQEVLVGSEPVTINPDGSFSAAVTLVPGVNYVEITMVDKDGNESMVSRTITLDPNAPALTLDSPADGTLTATALGTIAITGSASTDPQAVVTVIDNDGIPQTFSGGAFNATVNLDWGMNTITVLVTDPTGTHMVKRTVFYDTQKPGLSVTNPDKDITVTDGAVTIAGAVTDALTNVTVTTLASDQTYTTATGLASGGTFTQALIFGEEDIYPVTVTATDQYGNSSTVRRNILFQRGSIVINQGKATTASTKVTLDLSYSAPTGTVSTMQLLYNNTAWTAPMAFAAKKIITLPAGDGIKTVFVRFIDSAGNVSAFYSDTIILDTRVPVASFTINNGDLATTDALVTLRLSVSDANSGVKMQFSNNGTSWGAAEPFKATKSYLLSVGTPTTYGVKKVYARFIDSAGKTSAAVNDMIYYAQSPTPSDSAFVVIKGGLPYTTTTAVPVAITTPDPSPAPSYNQMQTSTNGTSWTAWGNIKPGITVSLPAGDGEKKVYVKFRTGIAGAPSSSYSGSIILDTIAPRGTIQINGGLYSAGSRTVTLTLTASDINGVAQMQLSQNNTDWATQQWVVFSGSTTTTLVSPGDGVKTVWVKFKDTAGKISAAFSDTILLDTTAPTGKVLINGSANIVITSLNVTLSLSASGATYMQLSLDGGTTWNDWEPFVKSKKVTLSAAGDGQTHLIVVQAKFRDLTGNVSLTTASASASYTKAQAPAGIFVPISSLATSYTVTWSPSPTAGVSYVLQEFTNPGFTTGLRTAYSGAALSVKITSRTMGKTYYYRVQAKKSGYESSDWEVDGTGCHVGP